MKKTLLHFITGCVTRHEARRFWRALGDSEQEAKEFIQKIQKSYEPGNPLSGFFKHLTKKLFGLEKSPFDLSPEEIERLTRVVRDRSEDMTVQVELVPSLFEGLPPDPQEIEYKVSDFYTKNKTRFDSVRDIEYDKEKNILEVRTKKRILANLLRTLGLKEEYIKKITEGDREGIPGLKTHQAEYRLNFRDITDVDKSYGSADLKKFAQVANKELLRSNAKIEIEAIDTPKDAVLVFRGDLEALEDLLHKSFREQQRNRSTYFPLHFDNSARIDQLIRRLRG